MKVTYKVGPTGCEITLDGKRIEESCLSFQLVSPAGQRPQVQLVLVPTEITIDAANPIVVMDTAEAEAPAPHAPTPNRAAKRSHKKKGK